MKKYIYLTSLIALFAFQKAHAQTLKALSYDVSNNAVAVATNTNPITFRNPIAWATNSHRDATRTNLGLGTAATNPSSAFQPANTNLTALASGDGSSLTNVGGTTDASTLTNFPAYLLQTNGSAAGLTNFPAELMRTNGNASTLTNFPAFLLRTNGSASALTNFPANLLTTNGNGSALTNLAVSNLVGTLALTNGGTGATSAASARTNLGLGPTNSVQFGPLTSSGLNTGLVSLNFSGDEAHFTVFGLQFTSFGDVWNVEENTFIEGNRTIFTYSSNSVGSFTFGVPVSFGDYLGTTKDNLGIGIGDNLSINQIEFREEDSQGFYKMILRGDSYFVYDPITAQAKTMLTFNTVLNPGTGEQDPTSITAHVPVSFSTTTIAAATRTNLGIGNWVTSIAAHHATALTPAAGGQTYYFGFPHDVAAVTSATERGFRFPYAGKIVAAMATVSVSGSLGVNQSTNFALGIFNKASSTASPFGFTNMSWTNTQSSYRVSGLNISVNTTNEYAFYVTTPTFSNAPTSVRHYVTLFYQPD